MAAYDSLNYLIMTGDEPWYVMEYSPEESNPKISAALMETVQDIERRQSSIFDGNKRHARIYAGYLPVGLSLGKNSNSYRQPFEATKAVVRSICDTATALIVRARPRAAFVTDGADWDVQLKADDAEQFCIGAYQTAKVYPVATEAFKDSTIFGTGGWKYVPRYDNGGYQVHTERVVIDDIVVDEEECRESHNPPNIYHVLRVRTSALIEKYAKGDSKKEKALRQAILANKEVGWPTRRVAKGQSILVDAYHIDDEGQNIHVIACNGAVLKREVWPFPWAPFTWLWWSAPITGFYGDGIAYRQYGRQERVSYMYRWVQRIHDMMATPTTFVDPTGGPPTLQMSNEIGRIVATRKPPSFAPQAMIAPEVYRWLDNLERGGFEDEGISQVTAQNELPPGLESAPAQREYSFKESQRFAPVSQRWEDAVAVDTATKLLAFYQHYRKSSKKGVKSSWAGVRNMHNVELPDLEEGEYLIRPQAASLESLSPAARMQGALELAQTQWITPSEGRALVGHPDLKEADELGNAAENYAKMVLSQLYHGEVVAVDTLADLAVLDRVIRQGRLVAIQRKAHQHIVDGMSRYLEELDVEKAKAMPMMGAAGPATPADFPQGERPRQVEATKV